MAQDRIDLTNQFLIPVSNGRSAPNKVEQNACLVEQSRAAMAQLSEQAQRLAMATA